MQKQFPLSVIVFIDSLAVSALQDAPGSYAISRQNNLELHLGCHWLPYLSIELFYIGLPVVRTGGRACGRAYCHVIAKFSRMGRLLHFLTHGTLLRELRHNQLSFLGEFKKFLPYCCRFRTEAGSSTFFAFVILLLKPLRSFFLIYFNYLIFVFFILHHYYNILLLLLFYLLKQVKQFLAPRSNKSEQHKFLKLSLLIMHRS